MVRRRLGGKGANLAELVRAVVRPRQVGASAERRLLLDAARRNDG
jgi:hypothetical protein